MPLPVRRAYAGAAEACTLSSSLNNSATSFSITGTTTAWPSTATGPFYMVIDPGLSTEEKVLVGARTGGSLSSVTRGVDGTSAAAHDAGASCYPVLAAVDLNEANLLASTLTTKGDLLSTDGSDPKRVAVGSNNTRLVADSAQTSGIKWVADTQNTVIDAKGDLLVGSANDTVARLAVGSDGHVLVADSTATNGLSYSPLNGWRNAIINGDFSVNQRGFTSHTADNTYGFDRWLMLRNNGTVTYSTQAFTLGNAITGQEPTNFARVVTTGQTLSSAYAILLQRMEGVRTFAGQTVTVSFWAKANTGTPKVALEFEQKFGTGGSPSAIVQTYAGQVTLSTSWARYSITATVPSISGKTLGTAGDDFCSVQFWVSAGTDYNSRTGSLGIQSNTFDFWGVQVEAGSDMTTFERRPQQVELALCQRYFVQFNNEGLASTAPLTGDVLVGTGSSAVGGVVRHPVPLRRTIATADVSYSNVSVDDQATAGFAVSSMNVNQSRSTLLVTGIFVATTTNVTSKAPNFLCSSSAAAAYLRLNAEL